MTKALPFLVLAACAAPATATDTTAPLVCAAPPPDVAVIDDHALVTRTCATLGERTQPEARIEVQRIDPTTISVFWTGGCEISPLVVTPITDGHRLTAYPAERDCVQTVGYERSITLVTNAPLGTVEYLLNSN